MRFLVENDLDLDEALDLRKDKEVNESLQNDEISIFFKRAKEVGAKTLGDLKRLLQEPEFAGKDEAQGMKDYRDSLGKDFKIEEALDLGKMQGIKLPDYYNTWSATDSLTVSIDGKEPVTYYLMENDVYGDETFYLVVTEDLKTIYETFDGIETCLRDELDTDDIEIVGKAIVKYESLDKKEIKPECTKEECVKDKEELAIEEDKKYIDNCDLDDKEAKELENLANNVIKENNKKIDENISIKDLDKQIADGDEEPVIDYANPNITSSPEQSKVVDLNSIEGK